MIKKSNLLILMSLLLTLVLAACKSSGVTTTPSVAGDAYPYPSALGTPFAPSPQPFTYPEPQVVATQAEATPFVVPEPDNTTGVVTGQLYDIETGEPMGLFTVYLAFKVFLTPGPGYTINILEDGSPHGVAGDDGRFAIDDVPPGNYLVLIYSLFASSVVMEPNTAREMEISVEAGKITDLGRVDVAAPLK